MKAPRHSLPLAAAAAALLGAPFAPAPAEDAGTERFFEARIRPVLVKHCYECHSTAEGQSKGGLLVDHREGLLAGGDSGPAVVPGDPDASLLLVAMAHEDPDLEMPPREPRLPDPVLADVRAWIAAGAVDPRDEAEPAAGEGQYLTAADYESLRDFWAYRPPEAAEPPPVGDESWPRRPVDRFILAALESEGLAPSPDAEPRVLLRRLHFDLVGLPPAPERAESFSLADLEEVVDELLASPEFGVRWGRHWLDVARFAESNGRESNIAYPHAWRYRDYVIDAFNEDIPYDRFLLEQIAGDLLPAADDAERARLLIATGFLALGAKGLNEQDKAQFAADLVDEQLDAATRALMASSVACARCHDHKTDPFTMEDYYALAGVFRSTETRYGTSVDSENNNPSALIRLPDLPGQLIPNRPIPPREVAKLKEQLAELEAEEAEQQAYVEAAQAEGRDLRDEFNELLRNALRIYWSKGRVEGRLATVDDEGNALPLAMGAAEAAEIVDSPLFLRGEVRHPADPVPRALPAFFTPEDAAPLPADESGRRELAEWLASPGHPLTARVMANRVWLHLFGEGLVRTPDNFGPTGEAPSHPELLDWLALRFQEGGWSVKALVREIVLSRAYAQASDHCSEGFRKDPDNRLLWRMPKRRLDAEVIRDSMLAASGLLDTSRRPGSLVAELTNPAVSLIGFNNRIPADLDGSSHRSAYLPVLRESLPDVLDIFDFAEPSLVTGARDETNVPVQALYLMNSEFVQEQAGALARRLLEEGATREERVQLAFRLCLGRPADETEMRLAEEFFESFPGLAAADPPAPGGDGAEGGEGEEGEEGEPAGAPEDPEALATALFCQALLSSAEFRIAD